MKQLFSIKNLRRLSRILFICIILLLPVFNILRYDSDTRELFLAGKVWTLGITETDLAASQYGEIKSSARIALRFLVRAIIPWLILLSIFPVLGFFFGRTFCGWLCPEGALFELADFLTRKLTGKTSIWQREKMRSSLSKGQRLFYLIIMVFLLFTIPPLMGIGLTGYFISPARIWHELTTFNLSSGLKAGVTGVSLYIFITSIFIRHLLCKYICAAGLMQMLFGWISPVSLRVRFLKEEANRCTDCKRCEEVCFMNIKPRKNVRDISCVNCMACLEQCNKELGRGLFSLQFGEKAYQESREMKKLQGQLQ